MKKTRDARVTWRAEWAKFTGEEAGVASLVAAGVDQSPLAVLVERHQATWAQVARQNRRRQRRWSLIDAAVQSDAAAAQTVAVGPSEAGRSGR